MSLLEAAIGWVAPPACVGCDTEGMVLCSACAEAEVISYGEHCWLCGTVSDNGKTCDKCRRGGAPRFVWVVTNYEGLARKLIGRYKFNQQRVAADSIAELMSQTLLDFNDPDELSKLDYLIVPVPTATSRRRQRGFDHAGLLAKTLAKKLDMRPAGALGRIGQSRQVGARREIRIKQAEDKYFVRLPELAANRNILLIDDVVTTGATLRAATKTLRQAGAKRIDALVFSKRL